MALFADAWIATGRMRRKRNRHRERPVQHVIEDWIRTQAPGRRFADIGCMWNVHGRYAFLAEEAGAASVTAFDAMDPTEQFAAEHHRRGSGIRFVQGDLHDPVSVDSIGIHDVVLCSGVIYHSPNPYLLLDHLHRITGDVLLLGSHTIPEIPGIEQGCVFYPGLDAAGRKVYARAHQGSTMPGVIEPFDETPHQGYANTWWGITPSALEAMMAVAGFEVIERLARQSEPFFTHALARKVERAPIAPPPSLTRKHAEGTRAQGLVPSFPGPAA